MTSVFDQKSLKFIAYVFTIISIFYFSSAIAGEVNSINSLPRRPFLGVTVDPAPEHHVRVSRIIPDSPAAQSGLAVGDILLALNGSPVESVATFLAGVKSLKTGDRPICRIQRGEKQMDVEVTLSDYPREQPNDIRVLYDAVDAPKATLRSIVTTPSINTGKLPAILFLQGFDCSSVDWPLPEPNLPRELIYRLTRAGFVVMRSEKSGVGDSTGIPCRDMGFHDEVSLFTSALKKLKSYDFVDTENVFLFGHSAGGWIAPLVAAAEPVKGVIVQGTVVRPFGEYFIDNWRRSQWLRFHPDLAKLEDEQRLLAQLLHYILVEKNSVREATTKHPELTAIAKKLFPLGEDLFDGTRSLEHVRELNDENVARVWASLDVPVLALAGEFDIRTLPLDHEYIAAVVNTHHPGNGTWQVLPKMDHRYALHETLSDAVAHEFVGPFDEQVVQETVRWIQRIAG